MYSNTIASETLYFPSIYFHWPTYANNIFSLQKEYYINAFSQSKTEPSIHMFIFCCISLHYLVYPNQSMYTTNYFSANVEKVAFKKNEVVLPILEPNLHSC